MSNRANGRKKSLFPAQTTVLTNASMDYFVNGVNYKIPYTNFVSGLGVTGTIVQEGAVSGTPVLDTQGTVNNIRNLEAGAGISTAISSENGITLKHNFTQDTTGSPVLVNPTATSPAIASIVAGSGISVTAASNAITIASTGIAKASKQVLISVLADLPSAVANVITLLADTEYLLLKDINIGANGIALSEDTVLAGLDNTLITVTYTGTGDMITAGDKNFVVKDIALACASGRAFKVTDTSAKTIFLQNVTITTCTKVGIFVSTASDYTLNNVNSLITATTGMEFSGVFSRFIHTQSTVNLSAGAIYSLATATFKSFVSDEIASTLASGAKLLTGAASSANIVAGQLGVVTAPFLQGAGASAPLTTIAPTDTRWNFTGANTITDTRTSGLVSMQGNSTNTVIASAGTPVLVAGTWVVGLTSQMTGTTAGKVTYNGAKNLNASVTAKISVEPVSGSSVDISAQVAINGSLIANSVAIGSAAANSPSSITVVWAQELAATNYVEIFISNLDSTVDLLAASAVVSIN